MIRALLFFLLTLYQSRRLILTLTMRDFKMRYLGSYLGLLWAFIQPTFTILIFWFVFQVGFKSAPVEDFPFVLWLICGMVPWFFIAEILPTGTNSVIENHFLVKKVVFRISMLPIVKLLSALCIHAFFVAAIFLVFVAYGYFPTAHMVQVVYYSFSLAALMLGIIWLSSAVVVFLKDIGQLVNMFLQFGFWLTPIFWSLNFVPEHYRPFFKLNPFYYIVQGYRDSFIGNVWFWEHPVYTLYYWGVTVVVLFVGALVFTRLRPHFADVM